jgi:phosphomannomutase
LVDKLLEEYGPAYYQRTDLRLSRPVAKDLLTQRLIDETPREIGGEEICSVETVDGVKYILADDSWLLIRPSGTEPVLRVYSEGRSQGMVQSLLAYGEKIAENST